MPKVVIVEPLPPFVAQRLRALVPPGVEVDGVGAGGEEELARRVADADVLAAMRGRIDARTLALAPRARFVQQLVVGYDNLDLAALEAAGIPAANNPGFNRSTVAEHAIMLMLVLLRRFVPAHEATRGGGFPAMGFIAAQQAQLRELGDETVGLVGFGDIGRAVAERLRCFGPRVLYFARHRADAATEDGLGVQYAPLDDLLARSSIVSLHVPSNPETWHLIGTAELARMQPGAFLVNTSRGDLVDEAALREAIQGGRLAGAGLDTVEGEFSEVNPFADLPQVVVTPHSAGASRTSLPRALELAAANIGRFLRGEPVLNLLTR